jgi:lincosamide nucleotidyltransferase A/C/D/E
VSRRRIAIRWRLGKSLARPGLGLRRSFGDDRHCSRGTAPPVGGGGSPDCGWGVDPVLGYQSRPHSDLDIVIPKSAVSTAREMLAAAGFTVLGECLPTALAMRHEDGREIDLHPVTPAEDGGGDQQLLPPEPPFHYDGPRTGVFDRTQVTCVDAATQLRAHLG